MKLTINSKDKDIQEFIYNYLRNYIYKLFIDTVDLKRLKLLDASLHIDSFKILSTVLRSLVVTRIGMNIFNISNDKNIKYEDGVLLDVYLRVISYGNREVKGYPIVYNILRYISNNINDIYEEWLSGN